MRFRTIPINIPYLKSLILTRDNVHNSTSPQAARQKLARDAKPQQDEDTTENERRISFTNSVELADTLGKRLEDLEKLVLTLAKG